MSVGVSWRESLLVLVKNRVFRPRILLSNTRIVVYRTFHSTRDNMPSSDATDCTGTNSSQSVELRFAKLTENAVKPTRGSELAAGFDLHRLI